MIVERRWEKRCDICNKLLAVKNFIFFKTVRTYVPVDMKFNGLMGNETLDMHICKDCWEKVEAIIRTEVFEDGK